MSFRARHRITLFIARASCFYFLSRPSQNTTGFQCQPIRAVTANAQARSTFDIRRKNGAFASGRPTTTPPYLTQPPPGTIVLFYLRTRARFLRVFFYPIGQRRGRRRGDQSVRSADVYVGELFIRCRFGDGPDRVRVLAPRFPASGNGPSEPPRHSVGPTGITTLGDNNTALASLLRVPDALANPFVRACG